MKGPDFDAITADDLADDERLKALYVEAVRRRFWPNTAWSALEFFCLAEKALRDDVRGTPGKLFYALVKAKNPEFVTQESENRALLRLPSHHRQDLVDRAGHGAGLPDPSPTEVEESLFGGDVGYYHGVMVQCFLPQKRLGDGSQRHIATHGRASMMVRAGVLADPKRPNVFRQCEVPFGSMARLILPYIIGQAVVRKSPEVDLGNSLRRFMGKLGVPVSGQNGRALTAQVEHVAAADFILGEWQEEETRTRKASVAKEVSFWLERTPGQLSFWTPTMVLSDEFYQAIQTRRVPVDMGHLTQLTKSPRRMDLYCWMAYRAPRIPKGRPAVIPLRYLHPIFAPDIRRPRDFRTRLLRDLKAIRGVYAGFNVSVDGDLLRLRHSAPPVPAKVTYLLGASVGDRR